MKFDDQGYEIPKEASAKKKHWAWLAAIGLQASDNLQNSTYLYELAEKNIKGEKSYQEVIKDLKNYYSENPSENRMSEADYSATRISELLVEDGFNLTLATLSGYHAYFFSDDPTFKAEWLPGQYRTVSLSKKEPVLNMESVTYTPPRDIENQLQAAFLQEKKVQYFGKTPVEQVQQVRNFISQIWHIHPFREGNTRTTAVFTIKYLRELGFEVDNLQFQKHSRYFRDALVLDNAPIRTGKKSEQFLSKFFDNLVLDKQHQLLRTEMTSPDFSSNSSTSQAPSFDEDEFDGPGM